jgi:hypothetical protein
MVKVPKLIKAVVDFSKKLPEQLFTSAHAVWTGLNGNVNFTNPPVDLNVFKAKLDAYSVSIGEARDGGKKAITLRNTLGEELIRMLRALALYVELNCKDDMNTFLTSGFEARSAARTPASPPATPVIEELDQGVTGQLLAWIKSAGRAAKHYVVRCGQVGPGGATPTTWLTVTVPNAKTAVALDNLTPGITYAVQVCAYGAEGYTPYSDSMTRMVI